jgi:hypothetical protein
LGENDPFGLFPARRVANVRQICHLRSTPIAAKEVVGVTTSYDKPHPNSILGCARLQGDQETMKKIAAGRKVEADEQRRLEHWAKEEFGIGPKAYLPGDRDGSRIDGGESPALQNGVRALEDAE